MISDFPGRELTKAERQAVDRLEKALAGIPRSLALFFHESGLSVFDKATWNAQGPDRDSSWVGDNEIAHVDIRCRYDTGAL